MLGTVLSHKVHSKAWRNEGLGYALMMKSIVAPVLESQRQGLEIWFQTLSVSLRLSPLRILAGPDTQTSKMCKMLTPVAGTAAPRLTNDDNQEDGNHVGVPPQR